jgi:hypothetical protein
VRCGRDGDLTRHRRPPDLMARIRAWFTDAGFDEAAFDFLDTTALAVGAGRLRHAARAGLPAGPLCSDEYYVSDRYRIA